MEVRRQPVRPDFIILRYFILNGVCSQMPFAAFSLPEYRWTVRPITVSVKHSICEIPTITVSNFIGTGLRRFGHARLQTRLRCIQGAWTLKTFRRLSERFEGPRFRPRRATTIQRGR